MPLFVDNGKLLTEPMGLPELFCSGFARIEFMGSGQACLLLYRNAIACGSGERELQACGRVYTPLSACTEGMELFTRALVEGGLVEAVSVSPRFLL